MELEVEEGDIAALDVDAIANAANDRLWMGSGVAGALKRAGGDEIEREAVAKGPIPLGTAVATKAGRLKAQHVLHGAVMGQDCLNSHPPQHPGDVDCMTLETKAVALLVVATIGLVFEEATW